MGFDKPYNQAPSLHIALLVIIWTMFARHTQHPAWRWVVHGWMGLIGLSVLTTWQHHFIDVPTGALAGFVCLWLWPHSGPLPWRQARLAQDPKRWRLALRYGLGTAVLTLLAMKLGGGGLWLLWPALSLLLVALNYALFGAAGFQKGADGRLSVAATWLLAPYLLCAWVNSRLWTWRHPQADEVADGVYLGRVPGRTEASAFAAIVDLSGELPCPAMTTLETPQDYQSLPTLDLIVPDREILQQAAKAIEHHHQQGPVLVCCALGYSRSASAVAAWLLLNGHCASASQAEALIRQARPGVVLHPAHRLVLHNLEAQP